MGILTGEVLPIREPETTATITRRPLEEWNLRDKISEICSGWQEMRPVGDEDGKVVAEKELFRDSSILTGMAADLLADGNRPFDIAVATIPGESDDLFFHVSGRS